jgi:hypothetical protein
MGSMNQTARPFLEFDMLSGNEVSRANTFGVEASLPENPLPKVGIPRPFGMTMTHPYEHMAGG